MSYLQNRAILIIAAFLFTRVSMAALPSLTELASNLATMRERMEAAATETAQLKERVASLTNLAERLSVVANSSRDLRRAFHGGDPVTSRFETNLATRIIQRVEVYPDGYEHITAGVARYFTVEELAARAAARQNGANTTAWRIENIRKKIADLEVVANNPTNRLAAAHAVIAIAAAQKQLARLEATATTNEVSVVIQP